MNVEIEGFTPLQRELADRIWALDSPDDVVAFFNTLPRNLLHDAYVVYKMIIETVWDDMDLGDCAEAHAVIERVRQLPC
jgi:hypothetical protein